MNVQTSAQDPTNRNPRQTLSNYIIGKTIGEGTFGKVKIGIHKLTNEKVAIKILEKEKIIEVADVERISREIHILKMIHHPNIIHLYEIIETPRYIFLLMEYVNGGELFDYIVQQKKVKEIEACKFFQQIIAGVEYLHKLKIVHRDLKPENLLLDSRKNIKIVDFGLSNVYSSDGYLKTACGSPCYAAPEMLTGNKYLGLGVDIWSCGVILFALICGYLPFEDDDTAALYKKIMNGEYLIPNFVGSDARDLIKRILTTDPKKRITLKEIKEHSFYKQIKFNEDYFEDRKIEPSILSELKILGFDLELAEKCIISKKHNNITTTYYLLLKKQREASPQKKSSNGSKKYHERNQSMNIPVSLTKDDENKLQTIINNKRKQSNLNKSNDLNYKKSQNIENSQSYSQNETILPPIMNKEENYQKTNNPRINLNATRLKNILMPKSINKSNGEENIKDYSYYIRKTENSYDTHSFAKEDDINLSRALKTTNDEQDNQFGDRTSIVKSNKSKEYLKGSSLINSEQLKDKPKHPIKLEKLVYFNEKFLPSDLKTFNSNDLANYLRNKINYNSNNRQELYNNKPSNEIITEEKTFDIRRKKFDEFNKVMVHNRIRMKNSVNDDQNTKKII